MGERKNSQKLTYSSFEELGELEKIQYALVLAYLLPAFETLTSKMLRAQEFFAILYRLISEELFSDLVLQLFMIAQKEREKVLSGIKKLKITCNVTNSINTQTDKKSIQFNMTNNYQNFFKPRTGLNKTNNIPVQEKNLINKLNL